jgi:hypothetical protein
VTDVVIFKTFSAKKLAKKFAFLTQNKGKLFKNLIMALVLEKNSIFFRRKLVQIEENCDHNIGHRLGEMSKRYIKSYFSLLIRKYLWPSYRGCDVDCATLPGLIQILLL